jgi:hypothetical protein
VEERLEQRSTLLAPGGAVFGRLTVAKDVVAVAGVSGLFPLSRDQFVVNAGQVHEIPAFSLQAQLGLEIRAF